MQTSELEVSKQKATELLRANEGDAVKAMVAYVNIAP
jgi:NACalpha-BTF3-like transcription factor